MAKETCVVYDLYTKTAVFRGCIEDCLKWINKQAYDYNYGISRTWKESGKTYYDVGRDVYYICD